MPIPLAIPLIMAGVGAATKVGSAIAGGRQMDKYEESIGQEKADLQAWYNVEKNRDFMESDVARAAMNKVLENIEAQNRQAESAAAITGASDASVLAAKQQSQRQFGDTVKSLVGFGTAKETDLDKTYMAGKSRIGDMQRDLLKGRAENWSNVSDAGSDLISGAAPLLGEVDWLGKKG